MVVAQAQQQQVNAPYTHASEPRAVGHRAKYRDEEEQLMLPSNIMYDRRVVRGNTYAAQILPAETMAQDTMQGSAKRSKRPRRPRTPDPVEGRRHIDIQTDQYLEELTDVVPEVEMATQTDLFMDRPPTPLFVPQKTGIDAVTQIEPGDLFDFDFEVEPILEVLVGKTLEQGLMEVMEEEELAAMRAHQEHFEQIRNAELVATQHMEAAERRKLEEKERRLAQERERAERERVVREKVAAATFARGYLSGMMGTVFDRLRQTGFFFDPVEREVTELFMPWLSNEASNHLAHEETSRAVMDNLVAQTLQMELDYRSRAARQRHQRILQLANYRERIEALQKEKADKELEEIKNKADYIIKEMEPKVADEETVTETRTELETAAQAAADEQWEGAKQAAGDEAREKAEGEAAERQAKLDEYAAAKEAYEAEEEPEGEAPVEPEDTPEVDVEAAVEAAVGAVPIVEPKPVTNQDVLCAMLDKGIITKDDITHCLAVANMGDKAYTYKAPEPEAEA
mmetsp:Transcript_26597/g.66971  ORF Transcript_26597/g.66971 Transcript_26597/m.66971 type:complete len:512 (+) Transcript_26597:216-1751(+)|eukprot:jgi/Tetstr1/423661/TSEL_014296.t1